MINVLIKSPVFKGIEETEFNNLMNSIHFQIKKYNKEEIIAYSGEICDKLMIIISGSVRGEMMDFSGKTIKIEDIFPPRPLAIAFIFGSKNRYPVNIVSNTRVEIAVFPKSSVIQLIQSNTIFLENFLNNISSKTQFLSEKIRFLSFKTIKEKIAHYLLQLCGKDLRIVSIPVSQTQLAEMFGVARPSLSRTFNEMERDGLIEIDKREITISDKQKLSNLLLK